MKRIIVGIIALIGLLAIYFAVQKEDGGIPTDEVDFAIEDVNSIDKISMKTRESDAVVLSKDETGMWWVNDEYPAFKPFIDLFLNKTLNRIKVKGPVAKAAKDNVIRSMVANAIKVDIYQNNELIKSYYVGDQTPDFKGTYMHIEGSKTPYIAYVPGFDGYITPKYNLVAKEWYNRSIFDYAPDNIQSIKLSYTANPEQSFELIRKDEEFTITPSIPLSEQAAKSYFALFKFKNFEGFADYLSLESKDSIKKSTPLLVLEVTDISGQMKRLKVFQKGSLTDAKLTDTKGNLLVYDPERYFATFTGMEKLVTIQDYTFGQLFRKLQDFSN